MGVKIKSFQIKPEPDFSRLDSVLRRNGESDRVVFYELFSNIEKEVLETLGNPGLPPFKNIISAPQDAK